jgi:hypothetical protein
LILVAETGNPPGGISVARALGVCGSFVGRNFEAMDPLEWRLRHQYASMIFVDA